ncbi:MAG: AzlD domain-containing protein [Treponema sp.]|nr:AzlD domain-containing protein [Treponema sp.]
MPVSKAIVVTLLIGIIVFCERLFPFAVFSRRKPGKLIHIFERYIPPVVMIGLLIYSLRDIRFAAISQWLPQLSAISFTIVTYLWKKNSLVSIFGGTIIYMILIRMI